MIIKWLQNMGRAGKKTNAFDAVERMTNKGLHLLAAYLSKRTEHMHTRKLTLVLFVVLVAIGLTLGLQLLNPFQHNHTIGFQSIRAPVLTPSLSSTVDAIVIKRIRNFHHYLDSVKANNRPLYDSIMMRRPHLMDSIVKVEQLINF